VLAGLPHAADGVDVNVKERAEENICEFDEDYDEIFYGAIYGLDITYGDFYDHEGNHDRNFGGKITCDEIKKGKVNQVKTYDNNIEEDPPKGKD